MQLLATVTKGLEDISIEEIKEIGATNIESTQKYIYFELEDIQKCSTLKTVDDVFLQLRRTKYYLTFFQDLKEVIFEGLATLNKLRDGGKKMSVTISVYKNGKIDKEFVVKHLSELIAKDLELQVSREDESDYNLRIIAEEKNLFVGLRLFKRALKDRAYAERKDYLGSLRPTIAAAIIRMVSGNSKGLELVDNFCGSGTFLAEGALFGHNPSGGDINSTAVKVASSTLSAHFKIANPNIVVQDAIETNWDAKKFDIAVSNYPWDSQIPVESFSDLYELSIKEYARILKDKSALGFILTKPELMGKYLKKYFPNHKVETRQIGYLGQTPWIVIAKNI